MEAWKARPVRQPLQSGKAGPGLPRDYIDALRSTRGELTSVLARIKGLCASKVGPANAGDMLHEVVVILMEATTCLESGPNLGLEQSAEWRHRAADSLVAFARSPGILGRASREVYRGRGLALSKSDRRRHVFIEVDAGELDQRDWSDSVRSESVDSTPKSPIYLVPLAGHGGDLDHPDLNLAEAVRLEGEAMAVRTFWLSVRARIDEGFVGNGPGDDPNRSNLRRQFLEVLHRLAQEDGLVSLFASGEDGQEERLFRGGGKTDARVQLNNEVALQALREAYPESGWTIEAVYNCWSKFKKFMKPYRTSTSVQEVIGPVEIRSGTEAEPGADETFGEV